MFVLYNKVNIVQITKHILKRTLPELDDDDKVGGGCRDDGEEQGLVDGEVSTSSQVPAGLKKSHIHTNFLNTKDYLL